MWMGRRSWQRCSSWMRKGLNEPFVIIFAAYCWDGTMTCLKNRGFWFGFWVPSSCRTWRVYLRARWRCRLRKSCGDCGCRCPEWRVTDLTISMQRLWEKNTIFMIQLWRSRLWSCFDFDSPLQKKDTKWGAFRLPSLTAHPKKATFRSSLDQFSVSAASGRSLTLESDVVQSTWTMLVCWKACIYELTKSTCFRIPYTAIAQWKTPVDWISFNRVKNGKSWELAFGTLDCYGRDVIGRFSGNVFGIQAKAVTLSPFFFYWTSVLYLLLEIFVLRVCPWSFLVFRKHLEMWRNIWAIETEFLDLQICVFWVLKSRQRRSYCLYTAASSTDEADLDRWSCQMTGEA